MRAPTAHPWRRLLLRGLFLAFSLTTLISVAHRPTPNANASAVANGTYTVKAGPYFMREGGFETITFLRDDGISGTVVVRYELVPTGFGPNDAVAGIDYAPVNPGPQPYVGYVTFFPMETSKTVEVYSLNDSDIEDNETFEIVITGFDTTGDRPEGGIGVEDSAIITIVDDDGPARYGFIGDESHVPETIGTAYIPVVRAGDMSGLDAEFAEPPFVDIVGCVISPGTATEWADYGWHHNPEEVRYHHGLFINYCPVDIFVDEVFDDGETVLLTLQDLPGHGFSGGAINNATTYTIIIDEAGIPTVQWAAATFAVSEGNPGGTLFGGDKPYREITIIATRSGDVSAPVTVAWHTEIGGSQPADPETDYISDHGTISWEAGDGDGKTFKLLFKVDTNLEPDETFLLVMTPVSPNAYIGTPPVAVVTLLNDDSTGQFDFAETDLSVSETALSLSVTVLRTAGTFGPASVNIRTRKPVLEPTAALGIARSYWDYEPVSITLNYADGQDSASFLIPILDDSDGEQPERFEVILASATDGATIGLANIAQVTIYDDDGGGAPRVTSITPDHGPLDGGTTAVITGANFYGVYEILFGDTAAETFTVDSDSKITVTVPVGEVLGTEHVYLRHPLYGTIPIPLDYNYSPVPMATVASNQALSVVNYTYIRGEPTVTFLNPHIGPIGSAVIVSGTYFRDVISVTVGGYEAVFVVNSEYSLTVFIPEGVPPVTTDIVVTTTRGRSTNTSADDFTVMDPIAFLPGEFGVPGTLFIYTLNLRWSLITWLGEDRTTVYEAIHGIDPGEDNIATNDVASTVVALWYWDSLTQSYKGYFVGQENVPGAADFLTLRRGQAYWVVTNAVTYWTILQTR